MDNFDHIRWIKVTPESVDLYNIDENFKRLPDDVIDNINDITDTIGKVPLKI